MQTNTRIPCTVSTLIAAQNFGKKLQHLACSTARGVPGRLSIPPTVTSLPLFGPCSADPCRLWPLQHAGPAALYRPCSTVPALQHCTGPCRPAALSPRQVGALTAAAAGSVAAARRLRQLRTAGSLGALSSPGNYSGGQEARGAPGPGGTTGYWRRQQAETAFHRPACLINLGDADLLNWRIQPDGITYVEVVPDLSCLCSFYDLPW